MRTHPMLVLCSLLATLLLSACTPDESRVSVVPEQLLQPDELSDLEALRAAASRVTPRHAARAAHFDAEGRRALSNQRFGVASKALATAVLYEPSALRLYLTASAFARIPRPRADERASTAAKVGDYQMARELLDVAAALADDDALTDAIKAEGQCIEQLAESGSAPDCQTPQMYAPDSPPAK